MIPHLCGAGPPSNRFQTVTVRMKHFPLFGQMLRPYRCVPEWFLVIDKRRFEDENRSGKAVKDTTSDLIEGPIWSVAPAPFIRLRSQAKRGSPASRRA